MLIFEVTLRVKATCENEANRFAKEITEAADEIHAGRKLHCEPLVHGAKAGVRTIGVAPR
jgi:hypothetical protein